MHDHHCRKEIKTGYRKTEMKSYLQIHPSENTLCFMTGHVMNSVLKDTKMNERDIALLLRTYIHWEENKQVYTMWHI